LNILFTLILLKFNRAIIWVAGKASKEAKPAKAVKTTKAVKNCWLYFITKPLI